MGDLKKYEISLKYGYANIREKPTIDSKIFLKLNNEAVIKYITKYRDWYYVYFADYPSDLEKEWKIKEYRGFVHKSQLTKSIY